MVPANPSTEGSGASPVKPQPSGPGDGRHTAPRVVQHHPAVLEQQQQRVHSFELRLADRITAFAGSMKFVYLHVGVFAVWMLFIERRPWATLTLIVSLEAIFLSTFVMIGQNRQAAFQQAKADHDFKGGTRAQDQQELTHEIHRLTAELHKRFLENRAQQQS